VPRGWQADTTPALNNIPTSGSAQAFNDLVLGGNRAAQQGQFETAIDFWKRAAPLDQSPNINCRGESLHTQIKAAQDTISLLQQAKLQAADAVQWFNNHSTELWMPNRCNVN